MHIPLELYPYFFKSVLSLIFDETEALETQVEEDVIHKAPAFMNVSITPVELSIICPRRLVDKHFLPVMDQLGQLDLSLQSRFVVSDHEYIAMQVVGDGLEAGKRVVELTSPLALAGMYVHSIPTIPSPPPLSYHPSIYTILTILKDPFFSFQPTFPITSWSLLKAKQA